MKKDFIKKLIEEAHETIWKNEFALKYTETISQEDDKKKEEKIKACQHAIEKDKEYINFLTKELEECESSE